MWNVVLVDEVDEWFVALAKTDSTVADHVVAAIDLLEERGPMLGRPTADRIKGSALHNLKELRPATTNVRILFVFDAQRDAVLLVAGDRTGNWKGWYTENIPVAEARFTAWQAGDHE